jgi:hypothetical protein
MRVVVYDPRTYIVACMVIQVVSFVLEWLYRRYCYPLTWYGFLYGFVTSSTRVCQTVQYARVSLAGCMYAQLKLLALYGVQYVVQHVQYIQWSMYNYIESSTANSK